MVKPRYPVKIDFNEEEYNQLRNFRKHYGLRHDTEAIRLALNDAYMIMEERKKIITVLAKSKQE